MARGDDDRPSRRINLAEPAAKPDPIRPRRPRGTYLRPASLIAAALVLAGGLFAIREPIGSAAG